MSKLTTKFSKDFYTLNGITKVVKNSDYSDELIELLANNAGITSNKLTAKQVGYFIPIEQSLKKEFTIYMYELYVKNFALFINDVDDLQISRFNCKMYQLNLDKIRLEKKQDLLESEIDILKIVITSLESKPITDVIFTKKNDLSKLQSSFEKTISFLSDIENTIIALNSERETVATVAK
jgi:hypothetical protein